MPGAAPTHGSAASSRSTNRSPSRRAPRSHFASRRTRDGEEPSFALEPMTVAAFYTKVMSALAELKIEAAINTTPSEVSDPIPFERDTVHASYDVAAVSRFWHVLVAVCQVLTRFRAEF